MVQNHSKLRDLKKTLKKQSSTTLQKLFLLLWYYSVTDQKRLPWLEIQVELQVFDAIARFGICQDNADVTFFPFLVLQKVFSAFLHLSDPVLQPFSNGRSYFCFFSLKFQKFLKSSILTK